MVSLGKRMRYVSDNESLSSSDNENSEDSSVYKKNSSINKHDKQQRQQQRNRCLSKNAIMARENRLRKKRYITNLENENEQLKRDNRKFTKIVDNQSILITNLKKEIKYLKSVLANSGDLLKLIKNINNTGMSVTTSLGNNRNLSRSYVYKPKQLNTTTTTTDKTTVWNCIDGDDDNLLLQSFPSPPSDFETTPIFNDFEFDNTLFNDYLTPLEQDHINNIDDNRKDYLNEHNYTTKPDNQDDDEVGVCLHVSKNRVSLEFCSNCSENASTSWDQESQL